MGQGAIGGGAAAGSALRQDRATVGFSILARRRAGTFDASFARRRSGQHIAQEPLRIDRIISEIGDQFPAQFADMAFDD